MAESFFQKLHNHYQNNTEKVVELSKKYAIDDTSIAYTATFEFGFDGGEKVLGVTQKAVKKLKRYNSNCLYHAYESLSERTADTVARAWLQDLTGITRKEVGAYSDSLVSHIAKYLGDVAHKEYIARATL